MTQHTTIADVAKAAGVSVTTVSRIINGRYDKMRSATRKRVEKAIKDLHFVPTEVTNSGEGEIRIVLVSFMVTFPEIIFL